MNDPKTVARAILAEADLRRDRMATSAIPAMRFKGNPKRPFSEIPRGETIRVQADYGDTYMVQTGEVMSKKARRAGARRQLQIFMVEPAAFESGTRKA